jgi:hypothetical protein
MTDHNPAPSSGGTRLEERIAHPLRLSFQRRSHTRQLRLVEGTVVIIYEGENELRRHFSSRCNWSPLDIIYEPLSGGRKYGSTRLVRHTS